MVDCEHCADLFSALCNMRGLQELTMVGMHLSIDGYCGMPPEIGSLHQLR